MNKELIGKCYKKDGECMTFYTKIIGEYNDGEWGMYDCISTDVTIERQGAADIEILCPSNSGNLTNSYSVEIPHEEFLAAYDKALKIINEYRTKL